MVDLGLQQRTISAEWQGIAQTAEQIRALFRVRRETKPAIEIVVTRLAALLDDIDATLERITMIQGRIDAMEVAIAESGLESAPAQLAVLTDMRNQVLYQKTIELANREQAMDLMIQVSPEDAWVYERENLAALHKGIADADAGRTHGPFTDDEFLTHLESLIAEDAHA